MAVIADKHDCIILDACCVINLYASQRMAEILFAAGRPAYVTRCVCDHEALCVGLFQEIIDPPGVAIDLQPFIAEGLLRVTDLDSEDEAISFVEYAVMLADGEAMTAAIGQHRCWAVATDNRRARSILSQRAPAVQLPSATELLHHWAETAGIEDAAVCQAISDVRHRGHYYPRADDPFRKWWDSYVHR